MKPIPDIVKEHVLKTCGRMPETDQEIDQYLDLLNLGKEYAEALTIEHIIGTPMMKRLGYRTPAEIRKEGIK